MAKQAAKVKLNHHKGSLSAEDCGNFFGRTLVSGPEGEASLKKEADAATTTAGGDNDNNSDEDSLDSEPAVEDAAPLKGALGEKPSVVAGPKKEVLTEQEMITEAEDALALFKQLQDETDEEVTEEELANLASQLKTQAASARKRSLVHYAKEMLDKMTIINGAKLLLQKAKMYRKRKTEAAGRALLAAVEVAGAPRNCLLASVGHQPC